MPGSNAPRGLAARFQVTIDGQNLGAWSSCTGLEVDFQHESYEELGNNQFVHFLPEGREVHADHAPAGVHCRGVDGSAGVARQRGDAADEGHRQHHAA